MSRPRDPRELVLAAVRRLLPHVPDLVLVGGCAPVTFAMHSAVTGLRPTLDLDCVVSARTYGAYHDLIDRLRRDAGLLDEIQAGDGDVHAFIRTELGAILGRPHIHEIVAAHFEADAATQATVPRFLERLRALVTP